MNNEQRSNTTRRNYRQAHILVVEDDEAQWAIIRRALEETLPDVKLLRVATVEEAIAHLDTCLADKVDFPKLVLLDIYLPTREEGWELLKYIKDKSGSFFRTPVVVLSNSTDKADVQAAYDRGVTSFLVKPTDYEQWLTYFQTLKEYWWETVTLPNSRP